MKHGGRLLFLSFLYFFFFLIKGVNPSWVNH
jgi:hypothetical protein